MSPKRRNADFKTITCFLPLGRAPEVLERLRKEKGVASAYAHHCRGTGLAMRGSKPSRLEYQEREMITALVAAEQADDVFSFIYYAAGIDQAHAGMVLMTSS